MAVHHVDDDTLLAYIRAHPHVRARDIARAFYTVQAQLAVGARLKRMVRAGQLAETWQRGWHYRIPEEDHDRTR